MARYHPPAPAPTAGAIVADTLEAVAREGARRMFQRALEIEVASPWVAGGTRPVAPRRATGTATRDRHRDMVGRGPPTARLGSAAGGRAVQFGGPAEAPTPVPDGRLGPP
jgi:hypothetical protein